MNSIKAMIVIYNKSLADTPAIGVFIAAGDIEIFIADNSTIDLGNEKAARQIGAHYFGMGGNMGLSLAYNRMISQVDKGDDIVCIFDDDSTVGKDYFWVLKENAARYGDINIFAPVVKDSRGILSPCVFRDLKGKRINRIEGLPQKGVSVINSGLAVRTKVFTKHRFDEELFLDFVDHSFIYDVTKGDAAKIKIMDTVIGQQFSGSGRQGLKADLERYGLLKKDAMHFCRKYEISMAKCRLFLCKRKAAMVLKNFF